MTFITRAANRYFATRPAGEKRLLARRVSAVWGHFDPTPTPPTYPCGFCKSPLPEAVDKHPIGTAYTKAATLVKWCDGSETP